MGDLNRAGRNAGDDIMYPSAVPFVLMHVACLAAIFTGVTTQGVVIAVTLYLVRMFAIGAGYHRYFSHRAYATSRVFQFILAVLAQSTAQKSVLWWAAKHRHHHRHSDTTDDVHSPRHTGFVYAHVGWIFAVKHDKADLARVADFTRFPELMWLHRFEYVPALVLGVATWLVSGWAGLVVGFFWSTVLVYHSTFCINSLAHVHGSTRYVTGDDSRNNWWLALLTLGEGWHNNHHAYQSSARQGFRWWEVDVTFYVLTILSWAGIVWDMKSPPRAVIANERRLGAKVIEKAAADVAGSFSIETACASVKAVMAATPSLAGLWDRFAHKREQAAGVLASIHFPHLPTRADVAARASVMLARTSSFEDIVDRAYDMLLDAIGTRIARAN